MAISLQERFSSIQNSATALLGDCSLLRMVCESDTRADDLSTRTAGFVGRQFVRHATERVIAALRIQRQNTLVPFVDVGDYDRFVAHCADTATRLGIDAAQVEAALLSEAELALFHARDALKRAHDAYRQEELDLAIKCGIAPPILTRADADAAFLERIEQEFPEFADRTGREALKAALCRLLEAQRATLS